VALCTVLVTIVSFGTYVSGYQKPQALFWDENYHIAAAQHYLNGHFFMEPHPPLGKLLIALGEYALRPNERFDQFRDSDHGKGTLLPPGFSFAGYRLMPTLLAWLTAPLLFLTAWIISGRVSLGLFAAALYTFDNAIIVHGRAAMLEGTQLFFVVVALLSFFSLMKGVIRDRYRPLVASILGAALGAAVATKVNALVFFTLLPLLLTVSGRWRTRVALVLSALAGILVVYMSTWYVHFSIAKQRNPNLKESGYYTTNPAVRDIIDRSGDRGPLDFVRLIRASAVDYFAHYSKGVPGLDLCKTGENGSPVYLWPFGARTIQYRWEIAGDNGAKYLYLVSNPVGWLFGITSLTLAACLLVASIFAPQGVRITNLRTIVLLVALYGAYMLAMGRITRVLYLYHYFIPLILSYLLASIMCREVERIGPIVVTDRRRHGFVATSVLLVFLSYLWYSPLTYYRPLTDREIASRALLAMWDLRCAGCPRTNYLASGGAPTVHTPRFAISGVKPTTVKQDWGQPRLGFSVEGKNITAAGVAYPNGFGMHSNATLSYPVKGRFTRLTGHAGLPDYIAGKKGSVVFTVEGDGKELWKSPVVRGGNPVVTVDVDISGIDTVTLLIRDAGDGIEHDHGFWADLKLEEAQGVR
jgi:4-amino-4-deoxy-L-arabinose transferase-like glycosyltransferase